MKRHTLYCIYYICIACNGEAMWSWSHTDVGIIIMSSNYQISIMFQVLKIHIFKKPSNFSIVMLNQALIEQTCNLYFLPQCIPTNYKAKEIIVK